MGCELWALGNSCSRLIARSSLPENIVNNIKTTSILILAKIRKKQKKDVIFSSRPLIFSCQFSTFNCQFSTFNCQFSTKKKSCLSLKAAPITLDFSL
jgi:hypothetical protein